VTLDDQQVIDSQALVVDVFKGFREELLSVFGNSEHTSKSDGSPVTIYDVKVEEALKARLAESFPNVGFQGEETGASGNADTYWLVDPIDGTSSFVRGLPFSTNMGALVQDGVVVAAVIYDFFHDVLYAAVKGKGAFKDGQPIHINDTRQLGNLFVFSLNRVGFSHVQEALTELGMRALLPVGACGYEYAMLAEGKIDGIVVIRKGRGLYDNAPGVLLCEEAGAVLLPYDDQTGVYRSQFVIGTPLVVDTIEHSGLL
jgi:myo-inositol-1(or 4)-monophosphatase